MNFSHWIRIAGLGTCFCVAPAFAVTSAIQVDQSGLRVADVPLQDASASFELRAFNPYAEDAEVWLVNGAEKTRLPLSRRKFYIGTRTDQPGFRVALSTDADGLDANGTVFGPTASWRIRFVDGAWVSDLDQARGPGGEAVQFSCGNSQANFTAVQTSDPLSLAGLPPAAPLPPALAPTATRSATVALDVDIEAMQKKYGNNTTTATNQLAALFTSMNVSYDAPLNVQLLIGTTLLRSGSDPYGTTTSTPAQLDLLAVHWRDNQSSVQRAFVMLISGVQSNGCSASGLAWVNAYCANGVSGSTNVFGSYSVNQLFHTACAGLTAEDTRIAAHELGHNFGASHTHCTANGGGTIDQCFVESGSGCFTGTTSCPAGGGSLMSYCHLLGGCSASLAFHPVHITQLQTRIAANTPSCIRNATTDIFNNGYE